MADLQRAITAFKNAHDAGDTAAAAKLANLVRQLQGQVQPPEQEPVDRTFMGQAGEFFRGIPRGAVGLLETAGIGASAMLPDEEEAYLRNLISGAAESASSSFQPKAGYEDSLAGTVGEALGSTVPFVLTGGLPGVAARVASGVALGSASGAGTARTRAEQAGATAEERAQATALGILPGAAEMVIPGMVVGRLRKAVGAKLATNIASRLGRVAGAAGGEGLQEAASEVAQNLIAQGIYNPEQGTFTNTGESLGLGAGVGGLIAALVELGIRDRSVGATPPPAQEPAVDQAALAEQQQQVGDLFPEELDAATSDDPMVAAAMARSQAREEESMAAQAADAEAADSQEQVQPDMVDIDETRQIQDLFDDEELARMQQEEDAQLAAQEAQRQKVGQQSVREDVTLLGEQLGIDRQAESARKRRDILLPIIESGGITDAPNLMKAFSAELGRQGFADTQPTATEYDTINRAVGMQEAVTSSETAQAENAAALQARQDAEQRAGAAPLESLIPERRTAAPAAPAVVSPQEQQRTEQARLNRERLDRTGRGLEGQLEIPVIPRAKGTAAPQEPAQQGQPQQQEMLTPPQETDAAQLDLFTPPKAPAPAAPDQGVPPQQLAFDLTAALDAAKVPKNAPVRKRVAKSKDPAEVKAELVAYAAASGGASDVAASVTALADSIPVETAAVEPAVEPVVAEDTRAPKEQTSDIQAAVTRGLANSSKDDIADAVEELTQERPSDPKAAAKALRLPEQVAVLNLIRAKKGWDLIELPTTLSAVQPKREEAADIPANQRIMQMVEKKATPAQILRAIIKDKDLSQDLRDMAAEMLRVAPDINVPVISKRFEAVDEVGEYVHPQDGAEAIYLDPRAESVAQSFVHEFIHAATADGIARNKPAGRRLKEMFEAYKAATPDADNYGFKNVYEFVAEAMTSPTFQAELKSRNRAGTKKSYWNSFVDFVKNILGIQKRSTLEEILDLTKDLSTAQNQAWQAGVQSVYNGTPQNNIKFLSVQGAQLNSTSKPMRSKPVRDAVAKVMGTSTGSAAGNAARTVLTWGLPLPALNDYVQSYIRPKGPAYALFADAVKRYTEVAVQFEGAMKQFTDGITAQITRMGEWKLKNADKYAAMTDLYFGGSHARVDLTKPESEYVGNPEKLTAYRKLKKQYDAIGPAGQAIYRQMRVIHNRQFKQISQQVFNRVYDATQDKAMATRIQNEFVKQMREKGPLEGYAPMLRPSGKHMLKYVQKNGEPAFEIFTNPNDQAARRQQLLEEGISDKDIKPFIGGDLRAFDGVVPSSFLGQLITTLKESKVEDGDAKTALIESVMALGVAMSPSNSVLERLASRKEVAGYIRDPFWAFQEGTIGLGRKLINMEYGAQLNKEVENMKATRENMGNDAAVVSIVDDIAKRAKYSANPSQSWWSNLFTTGTYGWTLGFNVSSAIVDMSSLVLVTGPYLTRTYGFAKTHRVMMAAAKDILGMGTSADVETLVTQGLEGAALQEVLQTLGTKGRDTVRKKTLPSVLNIDFNDPAQQKKYGYLKPLVDKVREAGHSERYSELAESAEFGESNPLSKWSARMGFMMNASERFKREIGLKTAYDLELSTLGANPTPEQMEAAAQKAMDMSLLLNGGSTAVTGARFQQNDIARIAFMYRRFAALQMYLQTKTAYDATMNDDPEVKAAARKFAAYTMLTSAAMVGVKGMPMMGAVAGLWAIYGALFGEEDEDNSLENSLRTHLDPILVEGIPNLLFNANVAGRMEMTNLLIRDSNLPNDATLADIVAAHFGGPAYGSVSRAYRGAGLIAEGEIQRGVESMLPASFSNLFKSARFLTEGAIETMRGDVVTEISPFGALSQALGFAPADYARTMDFNVGDSNAERRIKTKRTGLYEAVYVAYRVGDTGGVAQAIEKIIEFNARYPEFGITSEGLRQSIKGRDNNTQKMIRGRLPDERMRGNTLERAEDWGF